MLVTPQTNRRKSAVGNHGAVFCAVILGLLALLSPFWLLGLPLVFLLYRWLRRRTVRRSELMTMPFPDSWEATLLHHVAFFGHWMMRASGDFATLCRSFSTKSPSLESD